MDVLGAIGNTSLVRLRKVVPANSAQILAKLEWENPTGSMKDRMALAVISRAEADGRLKPGHTVIEYTGGSTGTSLALVCAAKGYPIHIVTSDAFSREKLDHMRGRRGASRGRAARAEFAGGHSDGRFRAQVSQHRRLQRLNDDSEVARSCARPGRA